MRILLKTNCLIMVCRGAAPPFPRPPIGNKLPKVTNVLHFH
jgi:hypothetical protein